MENNADLPGMMVMHANFASLPAGSRVDNGAVRSRMLLWCRAGHGEVRVDGVRRSLAAGDFLWLPWNHRISYRNDSAGDWELGGCHIVPEVAEEVRNRFWVRHRAGKGEFPEHRDRELPGVPDFLSGRLAPDGPSERLLDYLVEWFESPWRDFATSHALAAVVLAEIRKAAACAAVRSLPEYMHELLIRLEELAYRPLPVAEIVAVSGYGRSTLFRMFRDCLGLTPGEWLLRLRLRKAADLLRDSRLPLAEIAGRCGIPDANYFSKVFRRHYHLPPGRYRKGFL